MTDKEEQDDELLALSSIYDNVLKIIKEGELNGGELLASPVLPDQFCVKMMKTKKVDDASKPEFEEHSITYLPPIALNFLLPSDYPSCNPPLFTLACKWLNKEQLTRLCRKLDAIWTENKGCVILFLWNTFLQDELFDYLDLKSPLELAKVIFPRKDSSATSDLDERAIQEVTCLKQLLPVILEYNKQEIVRQFDRSCFECKVCFCEKPGSGCIKFIECGHIYCNECMRGYFTVQIDEGDVKGLNCPEAKCETQAHPSHVQKLVSADIFSKYDRLLLQTSLDRMSDVTYCPRPFCQTAVLIDQDCNMASCAVCFLVFCPLCNQVYHGKAPCRLKSDGMKKLREEYMAADNATKRALEKRYGKDALQRALDESFTNDWLINNSKRCPGCGCFIQKMDGCNKMTCMKCREYFCWLCNESLSRANPYKHYNTRGSECYNKLFEGTDIDDAQFDMDGFNDWMDGDDDLDGEPNFWMVDDD